MEQFIKEYEHIKVIEDPFGVHIHCNSLHSIQDAAKEIVKLSLYSIPPKYTFFHFNGEKFEIQPGYTAGRRIFVKTQH